MGYLIIELGTIALFTGFLALTAYERSRGARFFAPARARLDGCIEKGIFIFSSADFAGNLRDTIQNVFERVAHDLARIALIATRFLERELSSIVAALRARFAARSAAKRAPSAETSPFVRTIADFKQELRNDRPKHPPRKF